MIEVLEMPPFVAMMRTPEGVLHIAGGDSPGQAGLRVWDKHTQWRSHEEAPEEGASDPGAGAAAVERRPADSLGQDLQAEEEAQQ